MGNGRKDRVPVGPTVGSTKLMRIVEGRGPVAKAIRARYNRSQLWRWCTAKRRPELETLIELRKLTKREIELEMWARKIPPPISA